MNANSTNSSHAQTRLKYLRAHKGWRESSEVSGFIKFGLYKVCLSLSKGKDKALEETIFIHIQSWKSRRKLKWKTRRKKSRGGENGEKEEEKEEEDREN